MAEFNGGYLSPTAHEADSLSSRILRNDGPLGLHDSNLLKLLPAQLDRTGFVKNRLTKELQQHKNPKRSSNDSSLEPKRYIKSFRLSPLLLIISHRES